MPELLVKGCVANGSNESSKGDGVIPMCSLLAELVKNKYWAG